MMSMTSLYNISFLFIWCIAASSIDVFATNIFCPGQPNENFCDCEGDCTGNPDFCACDEAKACCVDATPVVLCPDQPKKNYCDCDGDCTEKPEWCQCADAQECCANTSSLPSLPSMDLIFDVGESGNVLCPDQPEENYCDCDGDYTEKPEWCQCADAQECCGNTSSLPSLPSVNLIFGISENGNVLCPGQPSENYC